MPVSDEQNDPSAGGGENLASLMGPSDDLLASMRASTRKQIDDDKGVLSKIREKPTPMRRMAVLLVLGIIGALAVVGGFGDTWVIAAFLVIAGGSFWLALKPAHEAPPPRWVVWALPIIALATAVVVASLAPRGQMPFAHHVQCFIPGMGIALVLLGTARLFRREPLGFAPFAGSVGAGLGANAFLAGRCHLEPTVGHLLIGHGSVLIVALALAAGVGLIASRKQT